MNIGEAALASGVSAKMIRHYEAVGLLQPTRRPNGYRSYSDCDVAVLSFIRHARELAFPLEEVRSLLALWRDSARPAPEVKRLALANVDALEAKAKSLEAVASSLRHLAAHCQDEARPDRPVLQDNLQGQQAA